MKPRLAFLISACILALSIVGCSGGSDDTASSPPPGKPAKDGSVAQPGQKTDTVNVD